MMAPIPTLAMASTQSPVRRGRSLEIGRVLLWGWEQTPHIQQEPLTSLGMWCNARWELEGDLWALSSR